MRGFAEAALSVAWFPITLLVGMWWDQRRHPS